MAGTKEGGYLARDTNIDKYGERFYKDIGSKGGKASGTGGFYYLKHVAKDTEKISIYGALGGSISRRGPNKLTKTEASSIRRKLLEEQSAMSRQSLTAKYGKKRGW